MGAGVPLSKGTWVGSQNPNDAKYFNDTQPWGSVAEVLAGIPIGERHVGLLVNVDTDEYTFETGIEDANLVLYNTINSKINKEPTGSSIILNVVKISSSDYDNAVLNGKIISTTLYAIPV